jgi:hypothetical protein
MRKPVPERVNRSQKWFGSQPRDPPLSAPEVMEQARTPSAGPRTRHYLDVNPAINEFDLSAVEPQGRSVRV